MCRAQDQGGSGVPEGASDSENPTGAASVRLDFAVDAAVVNEGASAGSTHMMLSNSASCSTHIKHYMTEGADVQPNLRPESHRPECAPEGHGEQQLPQAVAWLAFASSLVLRINSFGFQWFSHLKCLWTELLERTPACSWAARRWQARKSALEPGNIPWACLPIAERNAKKGKRGFAVLKVPA